MSEQHRNEQCADKARLCLTLRYVDESYQWFAVSTRVSSDTPTRWNDARVCEYERWYVRVCEYVSHDKSNVACHGRDAERCCCVNGGRRIVSHRVVCAAAAQATQPVGQRTTLTPVGHSSLHSIDIVRPVDYSASVLRVTHHLILSSSSVFVLLFSLALLHFSMARSMPSSSTDLVWPMRIALMMGLFPLLAATGFLVVPQLTSTMCGFPVPTTASHHSYVLLLSAREAYMGLLAVVLWWRGEVRALGWALLLLSVVPAVDGCVALQHGVTNLQALGHWGSIAAAAGMGYTLINARP